MTGRIAAALSAAFLIALAAIGVCLSPARAQDRAEVFPQIGHSQGVFSLAFTPDGSTLASGSADNTVKFWDVASRREIRTLGPGLPAVSMAFSPDGRVLAVGLLDQKVKLLDAATGGELHTLTGHSGPILSVAFSTDGRFLASVSDDKVVKLWDVAGGTEITTLGGFAQPVLSVAFFARRTPPRRQQLQSGDQALGSDDRTRAARYQGIFRRQACVFAGRENGRHGIQSANGQNMGRRERTRAAQHARAWRLRWHRRVFAGWAHCGLLELRQDRQALGCRQRTRSRYSHWNLTAPFGAVGVVDGLLADGTYSRPWPRRRADQTVGYDDRARIAAARRAFGRRRLGAVFAGRAPGRF